MRKEFYDMKVRFIGVLIVTIALFFIVAPFQKFTISMLEGYSGNPQVEKFLPGAMLNKLKEWNFYINSQWYGKNFGQMVGIIGIIMAFPLFAREFENETIVFLLVRKSRKWIYFNKLFTGAVATLIVMLVGSILPAIYSAVAGKEYNYSVVPKFMVHSIFGALLWYCVGVFFSVLFNDQVKPLLASLGLLALTTTAGLIKALKFLNTFPYQLGVSIFEKDSVDFWYTLGIMVVCVVITWIGYLVFERKEV